METAFGDFHDSFPPGEAMGAAAPEKQEKTDEPERFVRYILWFYNKCWGQAISLAPLLKNKS